jgi:BirA family biotin operon repressor/biotin-[acetyl-CoA-carboxylase] ligase
VTVRGKTTVARRLRRDMTEAERRLWRELRALGLRNRFRRQHPIGRHVVDFACPAAKLVVELDGGQHANSCSADEFRTREIARRGYRVVRFWNGDVMENIGGVLETISRELEVSLSALGGGEGRGEVGDSPEIQSRGAPHLTLPVADATGPLPLPPKGRRGH